MSNETKEILPYIDPIPSTATIAMLAATMKASPERALELWVESARMVDGLRDLTPAKRKAVLGMFGRDWYDCCGFMDNSDYRVSLQTAFENGEIKYPVAEAMKMLGISTEKTLWSLWEYLRTEPRNKERLEPRAKEIVAARIAKEIGTAKRMNRISEGQIQQLQWAQKRKREETGRRNKLSATKAEPKTAKKKAKGK